MKINPSSIVKSTIISKLNEMFKNPRILTERNVKLTEKDYPVFFIWIDGIRTGKITQFVDWYDYTFYIKFVLCNDLNVISSELNPNECVNIVGDRLMNGFSGKDKEWSEQNGVGLFKSTLRFEAY